MGNSIELVIKARAKDIGIPVRRVIPWVKKRMVGPFIFLDHMGPAILKAPEDRLDVRPHPHIGLSTLTYLFEGSMLHRDSLGVVQEILPGEVNWMTAGRGISHSERETDEARSRDRRLEGLQFWVALPKEHEDCEPSFIHYDRADVPEIQNESNTINLVAGSYQGMTSRLKTYSSMIFMVVRARSQGEFRFEQEEGEHALYIVKGKVSVDGQEYEEGEMIVLAQGSTLQAQHSADALFALIGGEVFPEPRYIWWNLVSSSKEKIEEAREAWINRSFPQVPGETEFIPAPEEPI